MNNNVKKHKSRIMLYLYSLFQNHQDTILYHSLHNNILLNSALEKLSIKEEKDMDTSSLSIEENLYIGIHRNYVISDRASNDFKQTHDALKKCYFHILSDQYHPASYSLLFQMA